MAETISMPKLGFDMREGILVRWLKNEGEQINKGDVLAEIETDKATVEVESSASGFVRKLLASQGDSIPVGAAMALIGSEDEKIEQDALPVSGDPAPLEAEQPVNNSIIPGPKTDHSFDSTKKIENGQLRASPLARKLAKDAQINLSKIHGTGPRGRIVRQDVEAAILGDVKKGSNVINADRSDKGINLASQSGIPSYLPVSHADKIIQTTKLRQAIGRRLVESKQNLPHFYVSHEYNMDLLLEVRKQINEMLPPGEKISVNDFIVKAAALALREYPNLNASLDGKEIIQHGSINIGVAVTVSGGLLTVVVKDADQKSLRQISLEVKEMAARARDGKIKPGDVEGSTFSTSNLGMYDVENFTAIINPPEAAILAIGSSREVPVVKSGQLQIGNRMKCTISVDHRISDGSEAAQFMQSLSRYLEEPLRLML